MKRADSQFGSPGTIPGELFGILVESAPYGLAVIPGDGRFLYLNPKFVEMFGYDLRDIPDGREWFRRVYPDTEYRHRVIAAWKEDLVDAAAGEKRPRVFDVVCKDGTRKTVQFVTVRITSGYDVMTCQDITEQVRIHEALKERENRISSIFRAAPVGIGVVQDRILKDVNETLCAMTGYAREELLDQSARMLYPTDDDYEFVGREKYARIRERGTGTVETRWQRKDGSIIYIILSSTPLDPGDWSKGVTFTALDITARKRAEDERERLQSQLLQGQKMEAIGTLAGGIAHDFNNLLMGIQGYTSLVLLGLKQNEDAYTKLKAIEEMIVSGAQLTAQLLGFARGGRYEPQPTNLNEIVEKTSEMFGRTKRELAVHRKLAPDLSSVNADRSQIEQVILNICLNAWQAMPGGGNLTLETADVAIADPEASRYGLAPGRFVRLTVTDTGIGMDESTRKRIFEPFFTTKEMGRGTGLGLRDH